VTADPRQTQLRVGRLTKAHGLKGAIKVELYTDEPEKRFVPGAIFSLQVPVESAWHGKSLTLTEMRWYNASPVAFFADVPDRTTAETLIKAILWVEHDASVLPDDPEAWYDHQLTGLRAVRDGVDVGTIARVEHFPAQDLLVVKTADGEVMVPFVKAIVPEVNMTTGIVTLTPPMGLFEELEDDDSELLATTAPPRAEQDDDENSAKGSTEA
jgi:16S rRNA processing protein RimM